jgi:hypothetical protein
MLNTSLSPNHADDTLLVGLMRKGYPQAAIADPINTK